MSPRRNRFKLLLDEMFARRDKFTELNNYHDLKHAIHDFKLPNNSDESVVKLAQQENRILISKNEKHMIELCKQSGVRLFCITEAMSCEQVDTQITAKLRHLSSTEKIIKFSKPPRRK